MIAKFTKEKTIEILTKFLMKEIEGLPRDTARDISIKLLKKLFGNINVWSGNERH